MRTKVTQTEARQATERADQRRVFMYSTVLAVLAIAVTLFVAVAVF